MNNDKINKINKIDYIKNMAVFKDFCWNTSMRYNIHNVAEFKKINILFGPNYSGKTTLSRILRACETGFISDKYNSPEFQLSFDDGSNVKQNSLNDHGHVIRVFNEDFVKENLRFIVDDEQAINSFAILGKDNTKIEENIKKLAAELGSKENKSGFMGQLVDAETEFENTQKVHKDKSSELEGKLTDKANNKNTGIKHNKLYGNSNYNILKLKDDIAIVNQDSYTELTGKEEEDFYSILKEEAKKEITEATKFNLQYSIIATKVKELIKKKIQVSEPIQELLNDSVLSMWVKTGREHHKGKRDKCAFCGNSISKELWKKLNKHFNEESEELLKAIDKVLAFIDKEKAKITDLLEINNSDFYCTYTQKVDDLKTELSAHSKSYEENLDLLKKQLEKRKNNIFTPMLFDEPESVESKLYAVRDSFEELRNKSNQFTASLDNKKSEAGNDLRLNEVYTFITDIKYDDECKAIETLKDKMDNKEESKTTAKNNVDAKQKEIDQLKSQLKDESKGAELVNKYLNHIFGHQFISMEAIEETSSDTISGYRFEVTRNGKKAFHLSEGECSLISFCYFMAKLKDVNTKGIKPIIWIDDPISSLDEDHIFFVYSLINSKIATPEEYEDGGQSKTRDRFKQLFISTHNLDFLKYITKLTGASKKQSEYFIITREDQTSNIKLMPPYLKDNITEFIFLFHQIYKCATAQPTDDNNDQCSYNFGNNARKFLEIFLYYKYPCNDNLNKQLKRFFGSDSLEVPLINRLINEFSHSSGVLERCMLPINVPEMKKVAQVIIKKIKEKDPEQYSAFLKSIGVNKELVIKNNYKKNKNSMKILQTSD